MRRTFVPQVDGGLIRTRCRLPQTTDFTHQQINLRLLTNNHLIELFEQILGKGDFYFKFSQTLVGVIQALHPAPIRSARCARQPSGRGMWCYFCSASSTWLSNVMSTINSLASPSRPVRNSSASSVKGTAN